MFKSYKPPRKINKKKAIFYISLASATVLGILFWALTTYWPLITGQHKKLISAGVELPEVSPEDGFILIQSSTFKMGTGLFEDGENNEKPRHVVTLEPFYIAPTEVTFAEYDLYCSEKGLPLIDDNGFGRDRHPVINVSWTEAIGYCNWLSLTEGRTPCYEDRDGQIFCNFSADGYRLPTEAEWEYAARGGHKSEGYIYSGSDDPAEVAWTWDNAGKQTQPVGTLAPNELGIYDMSGNVREWCWDIYEDYKPGFRYNPRPNEPGLYRVERGGRWDGDTYDSRPAVRWYDVASYRHDILGFRLARSVTEAP